MLNREILLSPVVIKGTVIIPVLVVPKYCAELKSCGAKQFRQLRCLSVEYRIKSSRDLNEKEKRTEKKTVYVLCICIINK